MATHVHAAEEIRLIADQSQVITLPEAPATVVVGNPAVADATTDGHSIYLHPRSYGLTNIIALDASGRKLGDYLVRVIYEDSYGVSIYLPNGRETYTCPRDCEPTLRVGDSSSHLDNFTQQAGSKNSLASGQALGEDLLTPSPVTTLTTTTAAP